MIKFNLGSDARPSEECVCVECLIGKQKKPILFKVTTELIPRAP